MASSVLWAGSRRHPKGWSAFVAGTPTFAALPTPFASGAKLRIFDNEFHDRTIAFCNTFLNISDSNVQPWLMSPRIAVGLEGS
jgi:hypothetical protein